MKAAIIAALLALTAAGPAPAEIAGYWKNPTASAIIAIAPCGNALCGKVVWASQQGQHEVARHAPKVVGTTVLTRLKKDGNRWTGSLYSPDDDIHVSARLSLISRNELKLTGCVLVGLLCRSQVWTRTAEPLPRTD